MAQQLTHTATRLVAISSHGSRWKHPSVEMFYSSLDSCWIVLQLNSRSFLEVLRIVISEWMSLSPSAYCLFSRKGYLIAHQRQVSIAFSFRLAIVFYYVYFVLRVIDISICGVTKKFFSVSTHHYYLNNPFVQFLLPPFLSPATLDIWMQLIFSDCTLLASWVIPNLFFLGAS